MSGGASTTNQKIVAVLATLLSKLSLECKNKKEKIRRKSFLVNFEFGINTRQGRHNHDPHYAGYDIGLKAHDKLKEDCQISRTPLPNLYTQALGKIVQNGMPLDHTTPFNFKELNNI